jgi:hypothetical protein
LCKNKKYEIEKIAFSLIDHLPEFKSKNGFRVPFDENYEYILSDPRVKRLFELGISEIDRVLGVKLKSSAKITPRLGWSIINIGCFFSIFNEAVNE